MKTKAQLKIQQMAFMLIAVTLFFVLVAMLVIVVGFSGLKQSATELEKENAMLLVTKLANSPEFSCQNAFEFGDVACVDADKIMMLKSNIAKYENFWDVAEIKIRKLYPVTSLNDCDLNNYLNCGLIKVYSRNVNAGPAQSNFVALCRQDLYAGENENKCELAELLVSYEEKR